MTDLILRDSGSRKRVSRVRPSSSTKTSLPRRAHRAYLVCSQVTADDDRGGTLVSPRVLWPAMLPLGRCLCASPEATRRLYVVFLGIVVACLICISMMCFMPTDGRERTEGSHGPLTHIHSQHRPSPLTSAHESNRSKPSTRPPPHSHTGHCTHGDSREHTQSIPPVSDLRGADRDKPRYRYRVP